MQSPSNRLMISLVYNLENMDKKTQFMYRLIFGIVIIGGVVFLSFRYLLKGSPFIKVLAIGLVVAVSYLVIDYLIFVAVSSFSLLKEI